VTEERRQHRRLVKPFEGNWRGASGANKCRIGDLSLGGCFVETLAHPAAGEETHVTVSFGGDISMTFGGKMIYVEPGTGFAVKFHQLDNESAQEISRLLEALGSKP
jgi:hypothetical protein